eukprot:m.68115 g.68115  ORF g.68115 m.68115 type:complete len:650 (-) comp14162_c1_seq1:1952-3901(-)
MSMPHWLGVAQAKEAAVSKKGVTFKDKQLSLDNAEQAKVVVDAIVACKDVEAVDLGGNTLSLKACEAIAAAIGTKRTMRYAIMDDMFTRRKQDEIHPALSRFSDALMRADCLTYLDMSDNALNQNGARSIQPLISTCLSLETLYLNNTGVGPAGGVIIGEALYAAYELGQKRGQPYRLRRFVLGRSRLENPGGIAISKALKAIGSLEEIRMNNNGMYIEGVLAVADMVGSNPNLKVLELSDNAVKARGAKALAKSLRNCKQLTSLVLETCLLRDAGTMALLDVMEDMKELTQVDFSYNEFTKPVGQQALQVLSGLNKLTSLALNGNELGESLCSALQSRFDGVLGSMSDNEDSGEEQEDEEDGGDDDDNDDGEDDDDDGEDDEEEEEKAKAGAGSKGGKAKEDLNNTVIRTPVNAKPAATLAPASACDGLQQQFSSLMGSGGGSGSTSSLRGADGRQVVPALGLAWASCVNVRMMLSRTVDVAHGEALTATPIMRFLDVVLAPHLPNACCQFAVEEGGVVGVAVAPEAHPVPAAMQSRVFALPPPALPPLPLPQAKPNTAQVPPPQMHPASSSRGSSAGDSEEAEPPRVPAIDANNSSSDNSEVERSPNFQRQPSSNMARMADPSRRKRICLDNEQNQVQQQPKAQSAA